uniref:non-specific serine/threonine protein kinase n=1 Tax=Tetradesmus obliquus TaxID=3088 RepID=A0A383W991_TETOB|eukprot:jgi/Sobl393_1/2867/SZX74001.1
MVHQDDFELVETISKGSFGTVYKAVKKADGRIYALKQVKLKGMKRVDREEAIDEARVLSQLSHPHITQHHGSFIDKDEQLNILMEYAAYGCLHDLIRGSGKPRPLPEGKVWKYIIQALLGLSYMHSRKLIHRDIKSLNLFLDAADNIKIGDLGITRSLSGGSDFARTIVGTPYYLSPELCDDKPYNEKSDVWALGVVLYECCMGCHPFEAQNEGALIRKILRGSFTPINGPYSAALVQLCGQMLAFNPVRRPTAAQLLQMPAVVNQARVLGVDMACRNHNPAAAVYEKQPQQSGQQGQRRSSSGAADAGQQPVQRASHQPASAGACMHPGQAAAARHPFEMPLPAEEPPAQQHSAAVPSQQQQQQQQQASRPQYPGDAAAMAELERMMAAAAMARVAQPEQLPPAGYQNRPGSARPPPFAVASSASAAGRLNQTTTSAQEAAAGVWGVKPVPPQFGRKRCSDLMATGPGMRGAAGARGGGHGAAPVADDATSYCSTSYQGTSYH